MKRTPDAVILEAMYGMWNEWHNMHDVALVRLGFFGERKNLNDPIIHEESLKTVPVFMGWHTVANIVISLVNLVKTGWPSQNIDFTS
jgi:hypothetical protein